MLFYGLLIFALILAVLDLSPKTAGWKLLNVALIITILALVLESYAK